MRWLLIAILAYACIVLQATAFRPGGLAVQIDDHWARPDLLLVFGLFLAVYLEATEALVVGWLFGLAGDLMTVSGRLGTLAGVFALVLVTANFVRGAVPRTRVVGQFLLTLVGVFVAHALWYLATRALAGVTPDVARTAEEAALDAAYSAVLAPYLFWFFRLFRTTLNLPVLPYD